MTDLNPRDPANIREIIEFNSYEGIRDQDGWETLTLTVQESYPELADLILDALQDAQPKILIIVPNYWGKGSTITEAWQNVKEASYGNLRDLKRGKWQMFFGHDTNDVKLRVDDFGNVCHHTDYPIHPIESHGV